MASHYTILFLIGVILGVLSILLFVFWLLLIAYRLYLTLKQYNQYLKKYVADSYLRSEILKALRIVRNRDIFLLILILLDIFIFISYTLILSQMDMNVYHSKATKIIFNEVFHNCTFNSMFAYSYIYPANALLIITFGMLLITEYMLISFLNSYLSIHYLGYSLPKKVRNKYIICWVLQYCVQMVFIVPKLQIFLPSVFTLLLFLNWLNLVVSSRKMCKAIRSRMEEIRLFEWNPTQYRQFSTSLKRYKLAMGFYLSGFLALVVCMVFLSLSYFLQLLTSKCYTKEVYGINYYYHLSDHVSQMITSLILDFQTYIAFTFALIWGLLFLFPSFFLFLVYVSNYLYDFCTGKGNMAKLQNELLEPLMK